MTYHRHRSNSHAIYHLEREHETRRFDKAVAVIGDLDDGTFDVEIWDTNEGKIISTAELKSDGDAITVPLPEFSRDIALKFNKRPY